MSIKSATDGGSVVSSTSTKASCFSPSSKKTARVMLQLFCGSLLVYGALFSLIALGVGHGDIVNGFSKMGQHLLDHWWEYTAGVAGWIALYLILNKYDERQRAERERKEQVRKAAVEAAAAAKLEATHKTKLQTPDTHESFKPEP